MFALGHHYPTNGIFSADFADSHREHDERFIAVIDVDLRSLRISLINVLASYDSTLTRRTMRVFCFLRSLTV